jgi:hypothetical protein
MATAPVRNLTEFRSRRLGEDWSREMERVD